jgi:hypothetical protein
MCATHLRQDDDLLPGLLGLGVHGQVVQVLQGAAQPGNRNQCFKAQERPFDV